MVFLKSKMVGAGEKVKKRENDKENVAKVEKVVTLGTGCADALCTTLTIFP